MVGSEVDQAAACSVSCTCPPAHWSRMGHIALKEYGTVIGTVLSLQECSSELNIRQCSLQPLRRVRL